MNHIQKLLNQGVTEHTTATENKHIRFTNAVVLILCFFVITNMITAFYFRESLLMILYPIHAVFLIIPLLLNRAGKRLLASAWLSSVMIVFVTAYTILFPFETFTITFLSTVLFLQFFLFPASDRKYVFLFSGITFACAILGFWWHTSEQTLWQIANEGMEKFQMQTVLLGLPSLTFAFGMYAYYSINTAEDELREEKKKADQLLLNILPEAVSRELSATGAVKPARFDDVTILFSDFKEFTNIVASIPTHKLIHELNDIFGVFDDIMEEEGVEKIQTIGDAYLAACGLPKENPNHALQCVRAAKKMIDYVDQRNKSSAIKWKIRIGIHSGPVSAGVVGKKKFAYTIFGDTINTASRLETSSEEGRINVSAYTYDLVKNHFPGEYRGKISAKGKGDLDMYFV